MDLCRTQYLSATINCLGEKNKQNKTLDLGFIFKRLKSTFGEV